MSGFCPISSPTSGRSGSTRRTSSRCLPRPPVSWTSGTAPRAKTRVAPCSSSSAARINRCVADATCKAAASVADEDTADAFDNLTQSPAGPYSLGTTNVTLTHDRDERLRHDARAVHRHRHRHRPDSTLHRVSRRVTEECAPVTPPPIVLAEFTFVQPPVEPPATFGTATAGTDNCSTRHTDRLQRGVGQPVPVRSDQPGQLRCAGRRDAAQRRKLSFKVASGHHDPAEHSCPAQDRLSAPATAPPRSPRGSPRAPISAPRYQSLTRTAPRLPTRSATTTLATPPRIT